MGYLVEKDKTGRARCTVCSEQFSVGDLRVSWSGGGKHTHLTCWKIKDPNVGESYFYWSDGDMTPEDVNKINEYRELAKQGKTSRKRKAVDNIDETKVKKIKTEILANDEIWDLSESKLSAPITLMSVEIMNMIFNKIDHESLAKSARVCKQWLVLATEDNLWQKICAEHNMDTKKSDDISWRAHYNACLDICYKCHKRQEDDIEEHTYFAPIGSYLCSRCIRLKKFAVISKHTCKLAYGLSEADLLNAGLKFVMRHGSRHFLKSQVLALRKSKKLIMINKGE